MDKKGAKATDVRSQEVQEKHLSEGQPPLLRGEEAQLIVVLASGSWDLRP